MGGSIFVKKRIPRDGDVSRQRHLRGGLMVVVVVVVVVECCCFLIIIIVGVPQPRHGHFAAEVHRYFSFPCVWLA